MICISCNENYFSHICKIEISLPRPRDHSHYFPDSSAQCIFSVVFPIDLYFIIPHCAFLAAGSHIRGWWRWQYGPRFNETHLHTYTSTIPEIKGATGKLWAIYLHNSLEFTQICHPFILSFWTTSDTRPPLPENPYTTWVSETVLTIHALSVTIWIRSVSLWFRQSLFACSVLSNWLMQNYDLDP